MDSYSAMQIAELGLPGYPATERRVRERAKNEGWTAMKEPCQGGFATVYPLAFLPSELREAIALATAKPLDLPATPSVDKSLVVAEPSNLPAITELKDWQRKVMDARLAIIRVVDDLTKHYGTNKAINTLLQRVHEHKLPANLDYLYKVIPQANARSGDSEGKRTLSRTSIFRWKCLLQKGMTALAPVGVECDEVPAWAGYFVECWNRPQKPTVPEAMENMAKNLPPGMTMPSYAQVMRFQKKRSKLDIQKGRKSGTELQAHKGHRVRDTSDLVPLEIGVCDGHSFKARVAHPVHGKPFYPEICTVVDAATRVITGWSVGLAESAQTVTDAIRHSATITETKQEGGIFNILYTDGGSGNAAKRNTDEFYGLFARIGTRWEKGIPGNAQGHGLIEIINKNVWIRAAKDLPTFSGKAMDKLTYRKMYLLVNSEIKKNGVSEHLASWPQFLELCQQTVDAYNRRPHSQLPKIDDPENGKRRHMCPLELWAWHISQGWDPAKHQFSDGVIEALFLPRHPAMVVRAAVTLFGNTYSDKTLDHYTGERVQVGYDIHNGERVQVFDKDGRLICWAGFEKNKSSYFPKPVREQANEARAKRRSQILFDGLDEIEAERRGVIDLTPQAKVIDITAASPKIKADREAMVQDMAQPRAIAIPADDKGKYRYWRELDTRLASGQGLNEDELRFYESYRQTRSYRAFAEVNAELAMAGNAQ